MGFQTINDLKTVLQAISVQREAFELLVDMKLSEALELNPNADIRILKARILTSSEMQIEYQKLVNLYGCIGSQSTEYVNALSGMGA